MSSLVLALTLSSNFDIWHLGEGELYLQIVGTDDICDQLCLAALLLSGLNEASSA